MARLRQRIARDEGFTLIELLVVMIIIGILLAIAIPSYLGFRDKANKTTAQANLREAIPSAEAYFSDHDESYSGMTWAILQASYDKALSDDVTVNNVAAQSYCLEGEHGGFHYKYDGPGGTIQSGTC